MRRLGALESSEAKRILGALGVLTLGRIAAASFAVGLGAAALEAALAHTRERVQFGGALSRQQFVRFTSRRAWRPPGRPWRDCLTPSRESG